MNSVTYKKLFPHKLLSIFMLGLWLAMSNSIGLGQWLLGGFLAWAIPYFTQAFWPQSMVIAKPWLALRFLLLVLWDIVIANAQVAVLIMGPRQKLQPAFMRIPLELKQDFTITLLANTISLTPGTVTVDLQMEEGYLLVHGLHVDDVEATIADIKSRYERPLKEIFECSKT
ncbi:Na+/H+ antiporter subunit E [Gilvimarinus agarilyticus]|uniref:Na+/H+ antiporter subunit E n=1 Tax=unclassified Gilvimarinus TaxID=2642066 RepID=UPI001C09E441|nr:MULTISPECIES: Na+/H+ antiporter subunit E [unclassified Gilvimarinus]MBU2886939.1 Na+/H+ antiporter subunit E [Gilvimarinus agarilyticus]MDO6571599.1 Na+/H+ antiporter subunit E [Gilvimarinus sp. 2_MG-2023]MDO6747878.1 Na+/H+ antiporter subunit E [Gilvimarinus sp. 1_MG-2023]